MTAAAAGENARPELDTGKAPFFARRGHRDTGIDFIEEAIRRAKRKAAERGVPATFLVKGARTLKDGSERFGELAVSVEHGGERAWPVGDLSPVEDEVEGRPR